MIYHPAKLTHSLTCNEADRHRKYHCARYLDCLAEAVALDYRSFSCCHCPGVAEGEVVEVEPLVIPERSTGHMPTADLPPKLCPKCEREYVPIYPLQSKCFRCRTDGGEVRDKRNAVILQFHRDGYAVKDIAKQIGMSGDAVRMIIKRAKGE